MKRMIILMLTAILTLNMMACSAELDEELLDSSTPPTTVTEEKPLETPAPTPVPEVEQPAVEETPTEVPEEAPVETPSPLLPAPEVSVGKVHCEMAEVSGYYDEIVSYHFQHPQFSGLGSAEAEAAVTEFYGQLIDGLVGYAYKVVYTAAQERHTGADVSGVCEIVEADGETLLVRYIMTVHYGDSDKDQVETREDRFDWATGQKLVGER